MDIKEIKIGKKYLFKVGGGNHFAVPDGFTKNVFTGAPMVSVSTCMGDKVLFPEELSKITRKRKKKNG